MFADKPGAVEGVFQPIWRGGRRAHHERPDHPGLHHRISDIFD